MRKMLIALIMIFIKCLTINLSSMKRNDLLRRVRVHLTAEYSILTSSSKPISFDVSNSIHNSIKYFGTDYGEPDTISWIDSMPKDAVLWDVGANIGLFSLYAASMLDGNRVRVVGFEPAAANYGALNRNIEVNAMADHVVAYCIALAGETKIGRMNMGEIGFGTSAGSWSNGFETEVNEFGRDINTIFRQGSVGYAIDDFVKMFQPPLPTHVKIDVDGIEAEILRGGKHTLSASSVRSMIVEMQNDLSSDTNRELFSLMDEFGFVPKPKQSPELRNVIFERPA